MATSSEAGTQLEYRQTGVNRQQKAREARDWKLELYLQWMQYSAAGPDGAARRGAKDDE
jgi:hypothetical protein